MSEWENGLKPWLGPPPSPDSQTWIPPVTPLPAPPTHQLMDDTASQQVRAGHVSPSLGSLTCEIGDKSCSAYTPKWSSWSNEIIGSFTHIPEKAMAPHSSTLAWKIPWTEEPGRLQSMGLLGVGHDWAISLSLFTFLHWRRKWQPTPVFLPGESQGRGSLVGCRLWGPTESDTTEAT